jgi:hypothetical protein
MVDVQDRSKGNAFRQIDFVIDSVPEDDVELVRQYVTGTYQYFLFVSRQTLTLLSADVPCHQQHKATVPQIPDLLNASSGIFAWTVKQHKHLIAHPACGPVAVNFVADCEFGPLWKSFHNTLDAKVGAAVVFHSIDFEGYLFCILRNSVLPIF